MTAYPVKRLLRALPLITLLSVHSLQAQLYILTATDYSHFSALRGASRDMAMINNYAYLLIGPGIDVKNTGITSTLLDASFDESYRYFILYPLRVPDVDALRPYGRVLHAAAKFIIFKTRHSTLNEFKEFHGYDVSLITEGNVTPDFSMNDAKNGALIARHAPDPGIQKLVDAVSDDSLWARLSALVPMERYAKNANAKKCAEYIQTVLNEYPFDTVYLQDIGSGLSPNVVAIKYGSDYKDSVFVVGGHYDVYAPGAPGADDNGSGASTVMEAARILSKGTYKTGVEFALFSAEEIGMDGSMTYVSKLLQDKKKVGGMLNIDVALYRWDDKTQIDATYDTRSKGLFQEYFSLIKSYLPGIPTYDGYDSWHKGASDNASFWDKGLKALMTNTQMDDNHVNPLMHTKNDNLTAPHYCRPALVAVTKAVVAATATWAAYTPVTAIGPQQSSGGASILMATTTSAAIFLTIPRSMRLAAGRAILVTSGGRRIAAASFAPESDRIVFPGTTAMAPGVYFASLSNGDDAYSTYFIVER